MALLGNWVKESTATTGTGTINLGGAETGFIAFSDTFSTADTVHYVIEDGNNKEYGIGTLTTGAPWTLARTTVLETLVSGTFDDTSPTAINLSGSATVGVAATANATGIVVGETSYESSALAYTTSTIPYDDTIPQSTEGAEWATLAYTPKFDDSKVIVDVCVQGRTDASGVGTIALFRDSNADADAVAAMYRAGSMHTTLRIKKEFTVSSTTTITFKVRYGAHSGAMNINGANNGRLYGGAFISGIYIKELRQ